jgi:hypothetical protein
MRRLFYVATAILTLVACCGCEKEEPRPVIEFSPAFQEEVAFEAKGGTWIFNFTSSADWRIVCDDEWVVATPSEGAAGVCSFTLTAEPEEQGEERSTTVKVIANNEVYQIRVYQHMKEIFAIDEEDSGEIHTIGNEGGTIDIDLATNVDYRVQMPQGNNASWISLNETRAMRDETISFAVDANITNISRTATISIAYTIDGSDTTHNITIVQDANGEPQNEIVYSCDMDDIVELSTEENFGARLALHFFDIEKRQGRVIFSGAISNIPADCFKGQANITSVTIPSGIVSIESEAFAGCRSITKFVLPTDLKYLGDAIFDGCSMESLICYNIPDQTAEDEHWLAGSEISRVTLRGNVGKSAFKGYAPLTTIEMDGSKYFAHDAFKECPNIESVNTPSEAYWYEMSIYNGGANPIANGKAELIADGTSVTRVEIPEGITKVGAYLFTNYQHVSDININDEVTSIGAECFAGCNVDSIYLGSSIKSVGQKFLYECSAESVTINFNTPNFQKDATSTSHWLHGLDTPSITFGDSVTVIGNLSISQLCDRLTTVTIGDNVASIGEGAFANCTALTDLNMGKGVVMLDKHAFYNCTSLRSIILPEGITSIESYAFDGSGIESIDLPSSVTTIGEYAFDNCASLTAVNCYPTTPPTLGNIYVFDHTTTIHVPATAYEEYLNAENWKRLKDQIVGDL